MYVVCTDVCVHTHVYTIHAYTDPCYVYVEYIHTYSATPKKLFLVAEVAPIPEAIRRELQDAFHCVPRFR